jgi:hypothetical protein
LENVKLEKGKSFGGKKSAGCAQLTGGLLPDIPADAAKGLRGDVEIRGDVGERDAAIEGVEDEPAVVFVYGVVILKIGDERIFHIGKYPNFRANHSICH